MLATIRRDEEIDVPRPPRMATGRAQHPSNGTVVRDGVIHGTDGSYEVTSLVIGVKHAPHVQLTGVDVLRVVQAARVGLPHVELRTGDRPPAEIAHVSADEHRRAA